MAAGNRRRMMGGVLQPRTSTRNWVISERKGGRGRELTSGNSTPQHLSTASWDDGNDGDDGNVVGHVPVVGSAVGWGHNQARRRVLRSRRRRRLGVPELDDDAAVGAAAATRGSPSGLLRVRRHALTILQPVPAFELMIEERRCRSISTMGASLAAVLAGIVVSCAAVVGPVVTVEGERRGYRELRVGQLERVGKGKRQT